MNYVRSRVLFLFVTLLFFSCGSEIEPPFDCTQSDLSIGIESFENASSCMESNGTISVLATGGEGAYQYKINDGTFQSSPIFENLGPGSYDITVEDQVGCTKITEQLIEGGGGPQITSIFSTDAGCGESNGSITVTATGGSNLLYKIGANSYGTSNQFSNLSAGSYTVTAKDDSGCEYSDNILVKSGVIFSDVKVIISNVCIECHDGNRAGLPNFTVDNTILSYASQIKTQTQLGSMPPSNAANSLTADEKNQIACWVDDGAPSN